MNIFWQELKMRRKSIIIWPISMVVFMVMSMAKYEAITSGGAAMRTMMASFPHTVQAIFGMNGLDIATIAGYYGVCFLFVAVICAVHAGLIGGAVVADDEQAKTTEFLYVKPRSRWEIISAKLGAGLVHMVIVWLAVVCGSVIGIEKFASMSGFWHDFWLLMIALMTMQLACFWIGALVSVSGSRATAYERSIAIIVCASYILYVGAKLSDSLAWMRYASIFSYFDATDIIGAHALRLHHVWLFFGITVVIMILTYIMHRKRDLRT